MTPYFRHCYSCLISLYGLSESVSLYDVSSPFLQQRHVTIATHDDKHQCPVYLIPFILSRLYLLHPSSFLFMFSSLYGGNALSSLISLMLIFVLPPINLSPHFFIERQSTGTRLLLLLVHITNLLPHLLLSLSLSLSGVSHVFFFGEGGNAGNPGQNFLQLEAKNRLPVMLSYPTARVW